MIRNLQTRQPKHSSALTHMRLTTLLAWLSLPYGWALAEPILTQDGKAGFVISDIKYVLGPDAEGSTACPQGLTKGYNDISEVLVDNSATTLDETDSDDKQGRSPFATLRENPNIKNLCMNPELGEPDPRFKTVSGKDLALDGLDLDALYAQSKDFVPSKTCPHDDFLSIHGSTGIDNQFYRLAGCSPSYQSTGISNGISTAMLSGSWGILIEISDVEDFQNDDNVTVSFYANDDPIRLDATRKPLAYASYTREADPHYSSTTTGHIRDGVLTTNPVDLRFHWVVNSMFIDRTLDDAIARVTINEDGTIEGLLAGFAQVEDIYSFIYGYRDAKDRFGQPAPSERKIGSSIGKALVQGYTCQGAYHALYRMADGNMDDTGKCHSISMQYRIKALPAFVIPNEQAMANRK